MAARRVTARDVAHRAGVSQSTVSYVLNDTPNQTIPEATKARVRQAATDLGYAPSAAARALRRGSSDAVLVVIPDAPLRDAVALALEGIAEVLEPHGYAVVYRRQKAGRSLAALVHELMPAAVANLAAFPAEEQAPIEATGIPVVGSSLDREGGQVSVPLAAVGRLQVEHLASRGHERIGYAGLGDPMVQDYLAHRLAGVRAECAARGLPAPVVTEVELDVASARRAVDGWLADGVTAVAAYNDEVAFAVLAGMRERGLVAPEGLAVIGVDNIPLGPLADPALTTVDFHSGAVGRDMGRLVLRRLKPELALEAPPTERAVELVERAST